ncbi:MAG: 5-(carboxyamino)imidazole ribonucleotide synthase [Chitinophagaceae bacterium]|nr:5-(carboxyamino)imidazole ribonucleotide synthase [Chitinophagaceae bacterium]
MTPTFFSTPHKLGILGGGQLGKMILRHTLQWDIYTKILDPDAEAPCRHACHEFVQGDLQDYDTVYNFGKDCTVLTIEIEHVNTEALRQLKAEGVIVHPDPEALATIQDKGLQKIFYTSMDLPTTNFSLHDGRESILDGLKNGIIHYPFVQKTRKAGYDGKGVSIIRSADDLDKLMPMESLVEDMVDMETEIAVIVARNAQGEIVCYDPVSMDFHAEANLLDLLLYPAPVDEKMAEHAKRISRLLIEALNICGLLAVEFLIGKDGQLWINEVAPRPHNSGHQTIESSMTSQYEQHLRGILNLPMGSTAMISPSAMVNLLGAEGHQGDVVYEGLEECLADANVHIHIYGKKKTKPFRKMGHVTVTAASLEEAKNKAIWIKEKLQVRSRS